MKWWDVLISDDLTKDHRGKVTFINFLDFLIKQQQGMDPFDEVVKVCRTQFNGLVHKREVKQ